MGILASQGDFFYFLAGLFLIFLVATCHASPEPKKFPPFRQIELFAGFLGVHYWFQLLLFSFDKSPFLKILAYATSCASIACLFEFARQSFGSLKKGENPPPTTGKVGPMGVCLPAAVLALVLAGFLPPAGAEALFRLLFGIPAAFLALLAFLTASRLFPSYGFSLNVSGVLLLVYFLFAGCTGDEQTLVGKWLLSTASFESTMGISFIFLECLLITLFSISMLVFFYLQRLQISTKEFSLNDTNLVPWPKLGILGAIFIGWFACQISGQVLFNNFRDTLFLQGRFIEGSLQAVLPAGQALEQSRFTESPVRQLLGQQFNILLGSSPDFSEIGIFNLPENFPGPLTCLDQSSENASGKSWRPTQHTLSPPETAQFTRGNPLILGGAIRENASGAWALALLPFVKDTEGVYSSAIGITVNADRWHRGVLQFRLLIITCMLIVCCFLLFLNFKNTDFMGKHELSPVPSPIIGEMDDLTGDLLSSMPIDQISEKALRFGLASTRSTDGFIAYLDQATNAYQFPVFIMKNAAKCQVVGQKRLSREIEGMFSWILTNRQTLLSNNPANDPRAGGIPVGHVAMKSVLTVPILMGETLGGIISVGNSPTGYSSEDQKKIERLARLFEIALKRKFLEEELRKARDDAQSANFYKGQFLANMSHEIRTPLSGIVGLIDLLHETTLTEEQKESVRLVRSSALSLVEKTADILDFTHLESGKATLEKVHFSLRDCLEDIGNVFQPKAKGKKLVLISDIEPATPDSLVGDISRLRQILWNLLGNAIKFTDKGEIKISIGQSSSTGDKIVLHFSISDTGIGIPPDGLPKLFQPFYQATSSKSRQYGGTGLGLGIAKRLTELLGGQIWVKSEPGKGSTFFFTATFNRPATKSEPAQAPDHQLKNQHASSGQAAANLPGEGQLSPIAGPITPSASRPLRILVVEDNLINQQFIRRALEKRHHQVTMAENGRVGLEFFSKEKFDLVFMDIQMPEMDGFEATMAIRRIESAAKEKTPIFAMTAHVMKGFREQCLQAGMDDYIPKPVDLDQLSRILTKVAAAKVVEEKPAESIPIFEKAIFIERMNGDLELCREIGELFLNETPGELEVLQKALKDGNLDHAAQITIAIKGAAANVSATALRKTCLMLEDVLKSAKRDAQHDAIVRTLLSDLDQFKTRFRVEMCPPS